MLHLLNRLLPYASVTVPELEADGATSDLVGEKVVTEVMVELQSRDGEVFELSLRSATV